jgi:coproporphyrinogen III oxidase
MASTLSSATERATARTPDRITTAGTDQPVADAAHGVIARRADAARWIAGIHDELTALFGRLDQGGTFIEDRWERPVGGGGVSRGIVEGTTCEKAGMNRSTVMGELPASAAQRLGGRGAADGSTHFYASGVSLVVHPRSPKIPTVHLNVRYFELTDAKGTLTDAWYGGGTDLTPFYPHRDDVVHFHTVLRDICDRYHPAFYPRYKTWCDEYFINAHRESEARGCGGVFFDHVRPGAAEHGLDRETLQAFVGEIGRSLRDAYGPLVDRRRTESYSERERDFQLWRRGRYVEFNLVHDRGTTFGLQTNARIESVLMSMPPLAQWRYAPKFDAGTFEAELIDMLRPQPWVPERTGAR